MTILEKTKLNLRIADDNTAFDEEIQDIIDAALCDLGIAGVSNTDDSDALVLRAVLTYVKMHFGECGDYERLKQSYDEQKSQMSMTSGYTNWR